MTIHSTLARHGRTGAVAAVLLLSTGLGTAGPALAAPPGCVNIGRAMQVTADCLDQTYATPVIDSETDETTPMPHHRIRGHFEGTNIQFTIYLHAQENKAQWEGRFFQFTYPIVFPGVPDTSQADDRAIGFALSSGGYAVQAGNNFVSLGYRPAAAAAKFAETVAA